MSKVLAVVVFAALASPSVVARIDAGGSTVGLAAGGGSVWAAADGTGRLLRIDPATNSVAQRIAVGQRPLFAAYGAGSVWVTASGSGTVVRVDAATGKVRARIHAGAQPRDVLYAAGAVWITDPVLGTVVRISPKTNKVVKTIKHVGLEPNGLAYAAGRIWAGDYTGGTLFRIDPKKNTIVGRTKLTGADWITVAPDALWVSQERVNAVARIDPATGKVLATVPVGANPLGSVLVGTDLWVPNIDDSTISIVDTTTNTVRETVKGPAGVPMLASLGGDVFASSAGNEVWRLTPG